MVISHACFLISGAFLFANDLFRLIVPPMCSLVHMSLSFRSLTYFQAAERIALAPSTWSNWHLSKHWKLWRIKIWKPHGNQHGSRLLISWEWARIFSYGQYGSSLLAHRNIPQISPEHA